MHLVLSVLFALTQFYGPKVALAHDGSADASCEARLELESKAFAKLGYKPEFVTEKLEPFVKDQGYSRYMISAKHPRFGMTLAFLDYSMTADGKTVEIEKVDVLNANNFRKGLSNLLFLEMLAQRPRVNSILATLSDVNLTVLKQAMGREGSCVEAFVATPLYQTAAHFGFTKIKADCKAATSEYKFVMSRGEAH